MDEFGTIIGAARPPFLFIANIARHSHYHELNIILIVNMRTQSWRSQKPVYPLATAVLLRFCRLRKCRIII